MNTTRSHHQNPQPAINMAEQADHHHLQNQQLYRFLAQNGLINYGPAPYETAGFGGGTSNSPPSSTAAMQSFCSSSSYNYYPPPPPLEVSLSGVSCTNQNQYQYDHHHIHETSTQDRALAALNNHKEAEKRRRERINSHLHKLRALLPCNSKTDKASLLAKVVERVKELKQQASAISEVESFPCESDEISTVLISSDEYSCDEGRMIFKASLCCEDRSDLLPDLIEILNSLHLKTLKADIATLGGRIRNVLVVAADKDHTIESLHFLQNAFKSLLQRSNSSDRSKRRRLLDRNLLL